MKENSKVKLERQLNENPELKERFNLQMEGIANRVKTITNVLSIEQFKEIGKLYNNRESDYNSLHNEKKELLKHRGIYAPKYAFEFLDWFFDCYLFGKPMHVKEDEGLSLYHFRLYNEYVDRLFEHKNWTDDKERDFLNNQSQGSNNESEPIKYKATHYALAYIFDCDAKGRPRLEGQKKELEKIGRERSNNKINGNTFYKAFNRINNKDLNIERNLIDIAGTNWKNIILDLSEDPDLLAEYLKTKQL